MQPRLLPDQLCRVSLSLSCSRARALSLALTHSCSLPLTLTPTHSLPVCLSVCLSSHSLGALFEARVHVKTARLESVCLYCISLLVHQSKSVFVLHQRVYVAIQSHVGHADIHGPCRHTRICATKTLTSCVLSSWRSDP